MDFASFVIVAVIILLCALPFVLGSFRGLDRKADELEDVDPQTAQAPVRHVRTLTVEKGTTAHDNRHVLHKVEGAALMGCSFY